MIVEKVNWKDRCIEFDNLLVWYTLYPLILVKIQRFSIKRQVIVRSSIYFINFKKYAKKDINIHFFEPANDLSFCD
jgi:hypothetical protein